MRWFTSVVATAMLTTGLGAAAVPPAHAAAGITLDKTAPASVLLGKPVPYTLKASNPAGNDPLYNVSFSDVLPAGFEYVGPTTPASAGEPAISTAPGGQTVLTWTNITDLQQASSFTIDFKAKLKDPLPTTIVPTDTNTAYVSGSTNERDVPKFNADGTPKAGFISSNDTATTARAPFEVVKQSSNSPEGELLRGVHDQRSTYTLTIRNNEAVPTNNVTVTDYLPAGLEFLGCGDEDNSQVVTEEYTGSGPLGTQAVNPTPCPAPVSVETVDSPQDVPGLGDLSGVYTAVTWNVGTLTPTDPPTEIKYVAGIPLFENTMSWPSGQVPDTDGPQGSNLDNNNGTSTREGIPEHSLTNRVSASGVFTGTAATNPVVVTEDHTVTIEDVRMQKDADSKTFTPGDTVDFTFTIEASEYMNADGIDVIDTLPDGYCPLALTENYWPGGPAGCAPGVGPQVSTNGGAAQPLGYAAGTQWNTNAYTVKLDPVSVLANKQTVITLPARMLATYRATGKPTVAGDSFEDNVELLATTEPIPYVDGDRVPVGDDSQYTQGTPLPTISKQMKQRAAPPDYPTGMKCDPSVAPVYQDAADIAEADSQFRKGDVICFKLRVDFPSSVQTKNAVVTDFPPVDTEFVTTNDPVTGNNAYALTTANNVNVSVDLTPTKFVLTLGDGGFVPAGGVFEATFAVQVLKPGTGTKPEITGNLMKMRTENTAGVAQSYRDQADYGLVPPPDLSIAKGVRQTTAPAGTWNPPQDNKPVQQGSTAYFQIDIANNPRNLPGADYSVRGLQVWDALPTQLSCSNVDLGSLQWIKPGTATVAALPAGVGVTCDAGMLKWVFPTPDSANDYSVASGQTVSLIYPMTIPNEASVSTNYQNTAYVRSFDAFTDIPNQTATYFPKNNVDTSVPVEDQDTPPLKDPSNVYIKNVTMAKTADTSVNETGNNLKTQATIGETITYTYSATVPAHTTVYRGELWDELPSGIGLVSIDDWGRDGFTDKPAGFTLNTDIGTNPTGKLTFPNPYSNDTNADQVFAVKVTAKVLPAAISCATSPCVVPPAPGTGTKLTNNAKFRSYTQAVGGSALNRQIGYDMEIVQPNPSVFKLVDPTQMTSADQEINVSIPFSNSSGRPPLHDWQVKDCLPEPFELVPGSISTVPSGLNVDNVSGCLIISGDATHTAIPAGGVPYSVAFKIKANTSLPAGQTYTNTATLTGSSMPGDVTGERLYTTETKATWKSPGSGIKKQTDPDTATIGERFTSEITVDIAKNLNYYSAGVVDTLPAGVNPASVQLVGITCKNADTTACGIGGTPLTPSGQKIGWSFGDILAAPQHRTVTIEYTAVVADVVGNKAGGKLTNSAKPYWSPTQLANPPTTIAGFEALPGTTNPVSDTVTIVEPDLTIAKTVNDLETISANPDDTFTYSIEVTNGSGVNVSTAYNIDITDTLPPHVEVAGQLPQGCAVSVDGRKVTCSIGTLAQGASATFSFQARLTPGAQPGTAEVNSAKIDSYNSLQNDQGREYIGPSDTATVNPVLPVLTITKDNSDDQAYIGSPYTWTIVVSNASGATAYKPDVVDTLPPNWTYNTGSAKVTISGGSTTQVDPTTISGQTLTWTDLADLADGKTLTITLTATPGPNVVTSPGVGLGTHHTNTAMTSWDLGPTAAWGTDESENATAYTEIASADLQIVKTHETDYPKTWNVGADEVVPGTDFVWRMDVTNNGPDPSMGPFTIEDTLPVGVTYNSAGSDWSCTPNGQVITCKTGQAGQTLAKGSSLPPLLLHVSVALDATGDLKNTAKVTGPTYDPKPINNSDDDTVTPRPLADVAIEKSRTKPYVVGGQVTYTLTVTNNGPSVSVAPITVEDTLPAGLSIASIDSGAWDCTPKSGPATKITCTSDVDMQPNTQADLIKITVDVLEAPGTPEAVNTAKVTPTTEDYDLTNNEDSVEDVVVSEVQLGITKKTTGANPVAAGEKTQFTITVTNAGPAKAKNVQVVDVLEPGLRATAATGKDWSCDVGTGTTVTCKRADFPVKDSPSDIVVTAAVDQAVPGGTTLKNTATVTTTSPQPGGDPDPAISTVDVIAKSDLAIVKTHQGGPWTIGKQGIWQLKVTNNGPSDNPGPLTVTDQLPRGNEFVAATGDGWECTAANRIVTCTHPTGLIVGQSSEFSIRVDVVAGAFPSVVNPAEVTSPIPDPNPDNNRTSDQVSVEKAKQTANPLPKDPSVLPSSQTNQGQKIHTKVHCTPLKSSAAGETSYCKVKRSKNGTIRIKIVGHRAMRVTVVQYARGTAAYKPWKRVKKYVLRP